MALLDISTLLTNSFVFQVFIPFIIIFAVFWGLLEMIDRFGSKVNLTISLGFALIAAYTNPWILAYIATLGSIAAVVLFGILFLFGVIRWGLGRGKEIYVETAAYDKQITEITKKIEKLNRNMEKQTPQQQIQTMKMIEGLEMKAKLLRRRQETLR